MGIALPLLPAGPREHDPGHRALRAARRRRGRPARLAGVAAERSSTPYGGSLEEPAMIPIRYNVRSLAVRKATTLATALGIALVVFVLASSLMLSAGIRKTLGSSGQGRQRRSCSGWGATRSSGAWSKSRASRSSSRRPGVKTDEQGKPLGTSEVVVVAAMPKLGADGVTNVTIRGVPDGSARFRPEVQIVAGRAPKPGADEVMIGEPHSRAHRGARSRPDASS